MNTSPFVSSHRRLVLRDRALLASLVVLAAACGEANVLFEAQPTGTTGTSVGGGSTGGSTGGSGATGGVNPQGGAGGVDPQGGSGGISPQGGSSGGPQGGSSGGPQGGGGSGGSIDICGDGDVDGSEECDGMDLGGASCNDFGFTAPDGLGCTAMCTLDPSGCESTCDGGIAEPGETCDGGDVGGLDCTDLGFGAPGMLACDATCDDFDTSGCGATCGNGVIDAGEDCDGMVAVSCTDFGFSQPTAGAPTCTFSCQVDISNCDNVCGNGTTEPNEQCDDANMTNGDGCSSACISEGSGCISPTAMTVAMGQTSVNGSTSGGSGSDTSFTAPCNGAPGPSDVYEIVPTADGFLTVWLDRSATAFDSVLFARTSCADETSTLLCGDSFTAGGANGGEVLSFPVTAGESYFVFVDGAFAAASGAYELFVDLSEGTNCNNPIPLPIWEGQPVEVLGTTIGKTQTGAGSCGGGGMSFGASDVVYEVDRQTATTSDMLFQIDTTYTNYDSVMYARLACTNNELECNDSAVLLGGEEFSLQFIMNDVRYLWVDGFQGDEGDFKLTVTPTP